MSSRPFNYVHHYGNIQILPSSKSIDATIYPQNLARQAVGMWATVSNGNAMGAYCHRSSQSAGAEGSGNGPHLIRSVLQATAPKNNVLSQSASLI